MASSALTPSAATPAVTPISLKEIAPWAVLAGLLLLALLYFVGAEQGATSLISGENVHEWLHDGRHLLGFPCH
ncbi:MULTISPECIES: CbtB domain-containing protein [Streptomyces]|uniref:CbtB domain-containing protein n=1 Tax=Streptomyces TaxID=1883 RepID=UPI00163C0B27|nr:MULTISPECIES: CbtB-domain containing protein [Streptomyces]MBC2875517.1 CbtB-domain containing protein [Streptomyces sp. TYQ1024]UBI35754.1 CbtB-domain containing protein [Streptomyces mobaraensis]UKW28347.1 CbtB-domain containing protein [Streptomyces sp. TYQ1024]